MDKAEMRDAGLEPCHESQFNPIQSSLHWHGPTVATLGLNIGPFQGQPHWFWHPSPSMGKKVVSKMKAEAARSRADLLLPACPSLSQPFQVA